MTSDNTDTTTMDVPTTTTTTTISVSSDIPLVVTNANEECVGPTSNQAGKVSSCDGCPNQGVCASGTYNNNTPEAFAKIQEEEQKLYQSLLNVSHIILVLSGKGGVGKSTLSTQIALSLSYQNYTVGLLDVDLCGPSVPQMIFGKDIAHQQTIHQNTNGLWIPVYTTSTNLAVMSINFLLQSTNKDQAVIWRGPRKNALIQQFITQVDWSGPDGTGLDYLIIDTPPGTSDEHISTVQYIQQAIAASASVPTTTLSTPATTTTTTTTTVGAIVVTTPEEASLADVRKELNFCQKTKLQVYGIIENMATIELSSMEQLQFIQSSTNLDCTNTILNMLRIKCPELFTNEYIIKSDLFAITPKHIATNHSHSNSTTTTTTTTTKSVVEEMAKLYQYEYWGTIPLDRQLLYCCENGSNGNISSSSIVDSNGNNNNNSYGCYTTLYPNHTAARILLDICQKIVTKCPVDMEIE
jgi:Mrp family chromosome partitioning ATPase